jgi:hypothetical protein
MDPASLIEIAKSSKAILRFIDGGGLKNAISVIVGDIHMDSAKLALETSIIANNKRDRINSVITHLEDAHIAYSSVTKDVYANAGFMRNVKAVSNFTEVLKLCNKDTYVCCLLAMCYASIGESKAAISSLALAEPYLELDSWSWHALKLTAIGYTGVLSVNFFMRPRGVIDLMPILFGKPLITKEQFLELRAALEETVDKSV